MDDNDLKRIYGPKGFVLSADGKELVRPANRARAKGDSDSVPEGSHDSLPPGDPNLQKQQEGDGMARQSKEASDVHERVLLGAPGHDPDSEYFDDPASASEVDGPGHPQYRIEVTLRFANYRQKDPDGCLSTIMDCIKGAVGRLVDVVSGDSPEKRKMRRGGRGRDDSDNKAPVKGKVPF